MRFLKYNNDNGYRFLKVGPYRRVWSGSMGRWRLNFALFHIECWWSTDAKRFLYVVEFHTRESMFNLLQIDVIG